MPTLYLTEQGSKLIKTSKRLVVKKDNEILLEVPEFKVDQVLIFGNIQITTQAMAFLLDNDISTSFLSIRGKLKGKLLPVESKNVYLRITQYERFKDEEFKLMIAKNIVAGKIRNQRAILQRFARNHPEIDFSEAIDELKECLRILEAKNKVSTVIGVEGRASAIYFKCFSSMFRKELKFDTRERRPPTDPINSLLSLGYTMLSNECLSILSAIGFDPYIGFLHSLEYGRPSLGLDLAEEFRQPIVDTLTLALINKEILKPEDFEEGEDKAVFLKPESRKIYFSHYEKKMHSTLEDAIIKEVIDYRKILYNQAQKLAKSIKTGEPYKPYQIK